MRTRTLTEKEALDLCEANGFTENHVLVINQTRSAFTLHEEVYLPFQKYMWIGPEWVRTMMLFGATIEVTETDVFDDPAFEEWEIEPGRTWARRWDFLIEAIGYMSYQHLFVRSVNPSDIPALAAAVNRLVEVGEVEG